MTLKYPTLLLAALLPTLGIASELTIEGSGQQRETDCTGQDVRIKGIDHRISLTGECQDIFVHGRNNQVTFEQGDTLTVRAYRASVSGGTVAELLVANSSNQVTATLDNATDTSPVNVRGARHQLSLTLASETTLDIRGAHNHIDWQADEGISEPSVSISGVNNSVQRED